MLGCLMDMVSLFLSRDISWVWRRRENDVWWCEREQRAASSQPQIAQHIARSWLFALCRKNKVGGKHWSSTTPQQKSMGEEDIQEKQFLIPFSHHWRRCKDLSLHFSFSFYPPSASSAFLHHHRQCIMISWRVVMAMKSSLAVCTIVLWHLLWWGDIIMSGLLERKSPAWWTVHVISVLVMVNQTHPKSPTSNPACVKLSTYIAIDKDIEKISMSYNSLEVQHWGTY